MQRSIAHVHGAMGVDREIVGDRNGRCVLNRQRAGARAGVADDQVGADI